MVAQFRHTPVRKAFLPWSHGTPVPLLHHFCRQFSPFFAHFLGVLHNMRIHAGYQRIAVPKGHLRPFFVLHNMTLLAAKHADFGGVTVHCDQIKPLLRTRRHALAAETATPWNRWPAARMRVEDRNRPLPWFQGRLLVTGWGALLRPVGDSGAETKKPPAPCRRPGATQMSCCAGGFLRPMKWNLEFDSSDDLQSNNSCKRAGSFSLQRPTPCKH